MILHPYHFFFILQEDLIICEYCDQGVHYSCLSPPPEKRPKVWDCDDCLIARGKPPNNNVKKRTDVGLLGPPSLAPAEHTKEQSLSRLVPFYHNIWSHNIGTIYIRVSLRLLDFQAHQTS